MALSKIVALIKKRTKNKQKFTKKKSLKTHAHNIGINVTPPTCTELEYPN